VGSSLCQWCSGQRARLCCGRSCVRASVSGVVVSVLASVVVDRVFEPLSGQSKDYNIGICCFSYVTWTSKNKDWLARSNKENNVFECGDMSTRGILFQ
jgi:fucose permease